MNNNVLVSWTLSFCTAFVFSWLAIVLMSFEEESAEVYQAKTQGGILFRLFRVPIKLFSKFFASLPMDSYRVKQNKLLIQASRPCGFSVDEFNASRFIAVCLGALVGAYIDFELSTSPLIALGLGVLGFVYPDIWLKGAIQKRRRSIFRNLPDTLDILRLAVDAGLDLSSALKVVVARGRKSPLLDELENVERDMTLGRTRKEALKDFADRIGMAEVNSFVLSLIQADQLGSSIGPVLKTQSDMARSRRWQLAEALVNKMPMKMLGPLVLFIFPSSFVILFTPLIIQWMQAK